MQFTLKRAHFNPVAGNDPPAASVSQLGVLSALALSVLRFYKRWISPVLPSACRFHPTCSEYMMQAIEKYGILRGIGMGLWRLLRCHPFHDGGFDPVR